jgi:multicomponent K+:H+ antiporter subunit A
LGILPEPRALAALLAAGAQAALGEPVPVSLAIWTGINVPLLLSIVAIMLGASIFAFRVRVRSLIMQTANTLTFNLLYEGMLKWIDLAAYWVTRVQNGKLRLYLATMLLGIGGLIVVFNALPPITVPAKHPTHPRFFASELILLRLFALLLIVISAAASVFLQRDLPAILALGVSGLAVAVLMVLEPAPDVALVQVVVDILLTIILVLLLTRLPRQQRQRAAEFTFRQSRPGLLRDGLIAIGSALVMTVLVYSMLVSRPRSEPVDPLLRRKCSGARGSYGYCWSHHHQLPGLRHSDRSSCFRHGRHRCIYLAALCIKKAGDVEEPILHEPSRHLRTFRNRRCAGLSFRPFAGLYDLAAQPGHFCDAYLLWARSARRRFTAGIMISLAVGLWYVVFGYRETKRRLTWLKSTQLIGLGLLLVLSGALISGFVNGSFFSQVI